VIHNRDVTIRLDTNIQSIVRCDLLNTQGPGKFVLLVVCSLVYH
jgi:hypothetical protein